MVPTTRKTDFLVLGSGIAGLTFALKVADRGTVTIVTKKEDYESTTNYAQGGVACVLSQEDTYGLHVRDTLRCGVGLGNRKAVEMLVREGPRLVRELVDLGVKFSRDEQAPSGFALGIEGGHSARRIVHSDDLTGREIERALLAAVMRHPAIALVEDHIGVELVVERSRVRAGRGTRPVCWGAHALNTKTGRIVTFAARNTLLATGGCGKVYLYTSNPDIATGDGIAMAYRAGAAVANLEFVQFHPTCLFHPEAKSFLISEAVRGEGAVLTTNDGSAFLEKYHKRASLAPRDVVARAIDREMKRRGDLHVMLDMRPIGKSRIEKRFPNIHKKLVSLGFDPAREPVPVVPAAHYMCGGVVTDLEGRTTVPGLYACGEVACTGVHGANRLASNSLLEALVFAERAANSALGRQTDKPPHVAPLEAGESRTPFESVSVKHDWQALRKLMWDYVGIMRRDERLQIASRRAAVMRETIEDYYMRFALDSDLIELRNIGLVAELIIRCALQRKESRGLHYNLDHPRRDDRKWKRDTVLSKDGGFARRASFRAWNL
ncbi:MAG: L-aspartate oxidase [Candidatus Eiseniibacteriota bacterium]|nr:MAG: L-aspartate oxidase [Candidatus Eisenbacteria bacterium]